MKEKAGENSNVLQSQKHFLKVLIKKQPCENNYSYHQSAKIFINLTYFPFLRSTIFLKLKPILGCSTSSSQLISDDDHNLIERFIILLYRASICSGVNQLRHELFSKKSRMVKNIPPTLHALPPHIKRAKLQHR